MKPIPTLTDSVVGGKTQTARILHYLRFGRRLTPLAALKLFGCMRLAARILELRQAGWQIEREMRVVGGTHWAEYRIKP